jgi:hypothetical protein
MFSSILKLSQSSRFLLICGDRELIPKAMEARDGAEHFSYSDPKPKIKRMMHGPEKMALGAITSGNCYSRLASMACCHWAPDKGRSGGGFEIQPACADEKDVIS